MKSLKKEILISLIAGALADILLRFNSDGDGNLLVHSVFFMGCAILMFIFLKIMHLLIRR